MKKTVKIVRCVLFAGTLFSIGIVVYFQLKVHFNAAKYGTEFEIAVAPDKKIVVDGTYLNFEMPCVVEGNFSEEGSGYLTFRKDKDGLDIYDSVSAVQSKAPGLRVRSRLALWDTEIEPPFARYYLGKVLSKEEAKKLTAAAEQGNLTLKFRALCGTGAVIGMNLNGKPVESFLK